VPRLVDWRGLLPPETDALWLWWTRPRGLVPGSRHGVAAFFQSLMIFESWLHLVSGGSDGM
jgi:hypothetical protein